MIDVQELPALWSAWRTRYEDRDDRHDIMLKILDGDHDIMDSDEDELDVVSPNFIQVAIEDTAEAASLVPTVRGVPYKTTQQAKDSAAAMERIATHYMNANSVDILIPETVASMAAFGLCPWVVEPDFEDRVPTLRRREAWECYPEPGWKPGQHVRKVLFARSVYLSQLPDEWFQMIYAVEGVGPSPGHTFEYWRHNTKVTLVEYYDDHEYLTCGIYESGAQSYGLGARSGVTSIPVELERIPNRIGRCPVVIGARLTTDGEMRGQFDQAVATQRAHQRLASAMLDFADQSVYSDLYVKDLIGEMSIGGGGYIELGPQGEIGRVPPAVPAMAAFQDLAILEDGVHLGGRWPKSRPGEVSQSIASAKFLEASAGMMNTVIKTYHLILKDMFEKVFPLMFECDTKFFPGRKHSAGILRNQQFLEEYDTKAIDLRNHIRVEYGLGLGRDPSQSAILHIQYAQNDYLSHEFVMENIDGLTDVSREKARIDGQKFREIMLGKILEGVQQGTVTGRQLLELARKRADGDDLLDLYEEFIVKPQESLESTGMQGGLDPMALLGPGMPEGAMAEGAPMGQPPVPPAPAPSELLNRLSVGAGGRSFMSSDVGG